MNIFPKEFAVTFSQKSRMLTLLSRNLELRTSVIEAYTRADKFVEKQRKTFHLHHLSQTNGEGASDQNATTFWWYGICWDQWFSTDGSWPTSGSDYAVIYRLPFELTNFRITRYVAALKYMILKDNISNFILKTSKNESLNNDFTIRVDQPILTH